ncbi:eukaryotic aspartyl protease [Diplocarpon rosae]|nr:eukaryotic aspartyl protease [Diplocarpon rosae]
MLFPKGLVTAVVLASTTTASFLRFPDYRYVEEHRHVAERNCGGYRRHVHNFGKVVSVSADNSRKHDLPYELQIRRLAQRLRRKYQRGAPVQPTQVHKHDDLAKRTNTYSISPAATPTQLTSAGIYQDGADLSYFSEVMIGSNDTPLYLLLDTGAAETWVKGKSCLSNSCQSYDTYDPAASESFKDANTTFEISYGSGEVAGIFGEDTISFAGLNLSIFFGIANTISDEFSSFPFDGILGLSHAQSNLPVFTDTLVASKKLKSNVFGISINRAADGANDGEINFGAPNTANYDGSLSYNAVSKTGGGGWVIPLGNVGFGTTQSNISSRSAFIDTGTSFIFCPPEDAKIFHALVPGAESKDNGIYTVPCDTSTLLTFTFGDRTYSVEPEDWVSPESDGVCLSYIYGEAIIPGNWLLGDAYLKNVYSLFDVDENKIGTKSSSGTSTSATADSTSTSGLQVHETPSSTPPASPSEGEAATSSEKSEARHLLSDLLPGTIVIGLIALVA